MKKYMLIAGIATALCISGCTGKQQHGGEKTATDTTAMQSITESHNEANDSTGEAVPAETVVEKDTVGTPTDAGGTMFDDMLASLNRVRPKKRDILFKRMMEHREKYLFSDLDSLYITMDGTLRKFIRDNDISLPQNGTQQILALRTMIDTLQQEVYDNAMTQWDINIARDMGALWRIYIFYSYHDMLCRETGSDCATKAIKMVQAQFYTLAMRQMNIIAAGVGRCGGSAGPMAYADLEEEMYDKYIGYSTGRQSNGQGKPIGQQVFDEAYDTLTAEKVRYVQSLSDCFDDSISAIEDMVQAIADERQAWNDFISLRETASRLMNGEMKERWDSVTYMMQKYHLVKLKNEFQGFGLTGSFTDSILLSDSCSYDELLRSLSFTVRMQLALKEDE